MTSSTRRSLQRWLPPLLWMALIFRGSSDLLSEQHTSRFIEPFLRWVFHDWLPQARIEDLHFLVRKAGHVSEYAVLAVLYWLALRPPGGDTQPTQDDGGFRRRRTWWAILLAAGFAASDEFHQSFVPSRGASVHDVVIDTVGAFVGVMLWLAIRRRWQARRPSSSG